MKEAALEETSNNSLPKYDSSKTLHYIATWAGSSLWVGSSVYGLVMSVAYQHSLWVGFSAYGLILMWVGSSVCGLVMSVAYQHSLWVGSSIHFHLLVYFLGCDPAE